MKTILNIKESPYGLLPFTALLLIAFVSTAFAGIDLQDRIMFTLPLTLVVWTIPMFLIVLWLLYLVTKGFLYSKSFTTIHVLVTVLSIIFIVTILYIGINPSQAVTERHEFIGHAIQILVMLFVGGQFIYVVNVLLGIFRRQKQI
jgi:hypothetical protein